MPDNYILSFGNSAMSFGGASAGWEPPYTPTKPYLVFRFNRSSFDPRNVSQLLTYGAWTRTSNTSANDWYWECDYFYNAGTGSNAYGWPAAFSSTGSTPAGQLVPSVLGSGNVCSIVGYGNLTASTHNLETMDRMFANCTALADFVTIRTPNTLTNVGACFSGCSNVVYGSLDQYTYWSSYGTAIANHSGTFTNCGVSTTPGAAELAQIPSAWGGTYIPQSYTFTGRSWSSRSYWECTANSGDVLPTRAQILSGLNLFTSASVSSYAGVNMRKTSVQGIYNFNSSAACYYYPAFVQKVPSSSVTWLDWKVITSTYNGMLTANQSSGDMPGTLDPSTFGPFTYEAGSYDSTKSYYFVFLVTNSVITSNYDLATCNYGILTNNYFKATMTFNWYI